MPNHWESSARPLSIKTVFVNGNRHAILFEEDPLRCGNSPFKKISRPDSSLSSESDLSLTTSHSQNSDPDSFKLSSTGHSPQKDLPSELQNCLVHLKLNSGNYKYRNKFAEEKSSSNSKEMKKTQSAENSDSKQKKYKGKYEKLWEKKHCELYQEPKKYKPKGRKNSTGSSCYVYNLENFKGKKNYCFVKITSQPPQFVLNCSCGNGLSKSHHCDSSLKNNMVISATIHNLMMNSNENEHFLENTFNYVFPMNNSDFHWNDYLTRSCCNSLSERVFQWLELARRRKQKKEKLDLKDESEFLNSTERIFSKKTFEDEIKSKENSRKKDNKLIVNNKAVSTTPEEEIKKEVVGKSNTETLLLSENLKHSLEDYRLLPSEINPSFKPYRKSASQSETVKQENNENSFKTLCSNISPILKTPVENTLNTPILNLIKSPLKIQDLFLNCTSKESYSCMNFSEKTVKNIYTREKKESFTLTSSNGWEKTSGKKKFFMKKSDTFTKQFSCRFDGNADKRKEQTLTEEFTERNQKSINNLNITRTGPLLISDLSSQQQDEKIIWASEKNTGRPQLHIFMPSILLKDQSDDGFSEGENLNS